MDYDILKKSELFSTLLDPELAYIYSRCSNLELSPDQLLFQAGTKAEHMYILRSGSIRVFRIIDQGRTDDMAIFKAGDTIGDFDFARRVIYDANAIAIEKTNLLVFPELNTNLDTIALERPDIISRVVLQSLVMLSGRIRTTQQFISKNVPWVQELRRRAYEDPATGLWNRAFLEEEIKPTLTAPTAILLIKPDRFKILVDTFGHAAGDEAMVHIATILKSLIRKIGNGWGIRLKSNEIALVLPGIGIEGAKRISISILNAIKAITPVKNGSSSQCFSFSASIVYAIWPEMNEIWGDFFATLYSALMDVWKTGGNRCELVKG